MRIPFLEAGGAGTVPKRLLGTETKESVFYKAFAEQMQDPILKFLAEIDQDVAADNEVHFSKGSVCHQIVVGKQDVLFQESLHRCMTITGRIIIPESAFSPRLMVVVGIFLNPLKWIYALSGFVDGRFVDVRGIDLDPIEQAFFLEQNGDRIDFLTGCASGQPDANERQRLQFRQNAFPHAAVKRRVPEHFCDTDRKIVQQSKKCLPIVEDGMLDFRNAAISIQTPVTLDTPGNGSFGVTSKIVTVSSVHGFE